MPLSNLGFAHLQHTLLENDNFAEPYAIFGIGTVVGETDGFVDRVINGFIPGYFGIAATCGVSRDPIYEGVETSSEIANPYGMFPDLPKFYQYLGSKTVPPCEEEVFWNYLDEYITIDTRQDASMRSLVLGRLDPENCQFDSIADPETGSTSRPAIDPQDRPVSLTGECRRL